MSRRQRVKNLVSTLLQKLNRKQVFTLLVLLVGVGTVLVYTGDLDITTDTLNTEPDTESPNVSQPDVNKTGSNQTMNGTADSQTPEGNTTSSGNTTG